MPPGLNGTRTEKDVDDLLETLEVIVQEGAKLPIHIKQETRVYIV